MNFDKLFKECNITPGPWYKDHDEDNGWPVVEDGYDFSIAMMNIHQLGYANGNAKIISQSPEMLKDLINIRKYFDRLPSEWHPDSLACTIQERIESICERPWPEVKAILESEG